MPSSHVKSLLALCALFMAIPTAQADPTDVQIRSDAGTLHGTLLLPTTPHHSKAAALIIAGSGPTDRDGNGPLGGSQNLRQVAQGLQRCGIASLRYDKLGVGASAVPGLDESSLTMNTFVDDATSALQFLQQREEFDEVWLVGHSEGGLIALAVQADTPAARIVLLATSSERYLDILRRQLGDRLPSRLKRAALKALDTLRAGEPVDDDTLPAQLAPLFRHSVQPFLRSADALDPLALIAAIDAPITVVQGATDLQVRVADARALAERAPNADVVIIEGMNHVLKHQGGDLTEQTASYGDPTLPLHPQLLSSLCPPDADLAPAVAAPVAAFNPAIPGDWSGRIKRIGLKVVFHFTSTDQGLGGTFDSPNQGAFGLPLSLVMEEDGEVTAASSTVGFRFRGSLRQTKKTWMLDGTFEQAGQSFDLKLSKHF
ncbi:MAG: alpha/beta hydrolase [Gammaproteobacteria bacterium]